jgi:hypothetical protein
MDFSIGTQLVFYSVGAVVFALSGDSCFSLRANECRAANAARSLKGSA